MAVRNGTPRCKEKKKSVGRDAYAEGEAGTKKMSFRKKKRNRERGGSQWWARWSSRTRGNVLSNVEK